MDIDISKKGDFKKAVRRAKKDFADVVKHTREASKNVVVESFSKIVASSRVFIYYLIIFAAIGWLIYMGMDIENEVVIENEPVQILTHEQKLEAAAKEVEAIKKAAELAKINNISGNDAKSDVSKDDAKLKAAKKEMEAIINFKKNNERP